MKIIINITHPSGYVQEVTVESINKLNIINEYLDKNKDYKVTKIAALAINENEFFRLGSFCIKFMSTLKYFSLGSLEVNNDVCNIIDNIIKFTSVKSVIISSKISDEFCEKLLKTIENKKIGQLQHPIMLLAPLIENEELQKKLSENREYYYKSLAIARGYTQQDNLTEKELELYKEFMKHEEEPFSSLPNFRSKEQDINFDRCSCIIL